MGKITLGSNYTKHYIGVGRASLHEYQDAYLSAQMHQLYSPKTFFWPYLLLLGHIYPYFGHIYPFMVMFDLIYPYFTVFVHILLY